VRRSSTCDHDADPSAEGGAINPMLYVGFAFASSAAMVL
jgi:hypothetical protein